MALLGISNKRLKASTLMETLVATVLIMVIFMVTSLVLNNLFAGSIKKQQEDIGFRLSILEYKVQHGQLRWPYDETTGMWKISVREQKEQPGKGMMSGGTHFLEIEAIHTGSGKVISREIMYRDE